MLNQSFLDPSPRLSTTSNSMEPDLVFLENLDGRCYATSTAFIDIPVKRNSTSVPNQASSKPLFYSRKSPEPPQQDIDTYVDFKKSLGPLIEVEELSQQELSFSLAGPPSETQWYHLNQLRIHAGAPERSEAGIERLLQYYFQLVSMERKFPFDTLRVDIWFAWKDAFQSNAFSSKRVSTNCIQYEKGAVIFNIAAIYSQLAANQPFKTSAGKKKAATYFQKASSMFLFCRDSIITRFRVKMDKANTDMSEDVLSSLSEVMLGQAVECFYEKANEGLLILLIVKLISVVLSLLRLR